MAKAAIPGMIRPDRFLSQTCCSTQLPSDKWGLKSRNSWKPVRSGRQIIECLLSGQRAPEFDAPGLVSDFAQGWLAGSNNLHSEIEDELLGRALRAATPMVLRMAIALTVARIAAPDAVARFTCASTSTLTMVLAIRVIQSCTDGLLVQTIQSSSRSIVVN